MITLQTPRAVMAPFQILFNSSNQREGERDSYRICHFSTQKRLASRVFNQKGFLKVYSQSIFLFTMYVKFLIVVVLFYFD